MLAITRAAERALLFARLPAPCADEAGPGASRTVEITQAGLRQVEVNPKAGLTFAAALRAFLRSDPDVVMVGEIREPVNEIKRMIIDGASAAALFDVADLDVDGKDTLEALSTFRAMTKWPVRRRSSVLRTQRPDSRSPV
jgi:hypothetical protein